MYDLKITHVGLVGRDIDDDLISRKTCTSGHIFGQITEIVIREIFFVEKSPGKFSDPEVHRDTKFVPRNSVSISFEFFHEKNVASRYMFVLYIAAGCMYKRSCGTKPHVQKQLPQSRNEKSVCINAF